MRLFFLSATKNMHHIILIEDCEDDVIRFSDFSGEDFIFWLDEYSAVLHPWTQFYDFLGSDFWEGS